MESNLLNHMKTALICLIITIMSIMTYDRFYATKIVSMDTTTYLKNIQAEYVKGKMTDQELEKKLNRLKDTLNSQPQNCIVLNAEVVMKNAERIEP